MVKQGDHRINEPDIIWWFIIIVLIIAILPLHSQWNWAPIRI